MNHRYARLLGVIVLFAGALAACGQSAALPNPCHECTSGTGAVQVSVALTTADVVRVVATVTGAGIGTPLTSELTIGGAPLSATGEIMNIPVGPQQVVTLAAYPAAPTDPEGAVVIYQGQTQVAVTAGQIASASLTLYPVVGDVAVTANFPSGDTDVARIDHTTVVVSGNRIESPVTFYLQLSTSSNDATGTAQKIPVGLTRTVTVTSFAVDGTQLHQGIATTPVAASGTSVTVTMVNTTGQGAVSLDGGFCAPSCGSAVCGNDGCGGSCGGCEPNATCTAGACVAPAACSWQLVASYPLSSTPSGAVIRNGAAGGQGVATVSGETAWDQTSDWNVLLLPTNMALDDDAFAVASEIFIPNITSGVGVTDIVLFTTTATANGPQGTCQWVGGVWGGVNVVASSGNTFQWWDSTGCPQNQLESVPIASPTGQWHQLLIKGIRSTCNYTALLDGAVVSTWTGTCDATGDYIGLYGGGTTYVGWNNVTVSKGTPAGCTP